MKNLELIKKKQPEANGERAKITKVREKFGFQTPVFNEKGTSSSPSVVNDFCVFVIVNFLLLTIS